MSVFSVKLDALHDTISLAAAAPPAALAMTIREGLGRPAYVVSSGGSQVAGYFAMRCRQTLGAAATIVQSPLAFVLDDASLVGCDVWLISAGGDNADIKAARTAARSRGAYSVHLVTSNENASVASEALSSVHLAPVADRKDGFLATHSLASAIVRLLIASDFICCGDDAKVVEAFQTEAARLLSQSHRAELEAELRALGDFETLIVLSDPRLEAAAVTIETSIWETALCAIQRTDFRNFAHGRHIWLAKRGERTALVALTGTDTTNIWSGLRDAAPATIGSFVRDFGSCGRFESAVAIVAALTIVEAIGSLKGIDPGRPGVADFGRVMYSDTALVELSEKLSAPVRAKRQAAAEHRSSLDADYVAAEHAFLHLLTTASFAGIIFDYDGTLVSTSGRYHPPEHEIAEQITRLIELGVTVAIATGRGGSAGEDLRRVLAPAHHDAVVVGYYNGAHIRQLSVDISDDPAPRAPEIEVVERWIDAHADAFAKLDFKRSGVQLSIPLTHLRQANDFAASLAEHFPDLYFTRSEHSLDICLATACKTHVIEAVRKKRPDGGILCIGDSGHAAGNDHKLLGGALGLSVGRVCSRPETGWTLFGPELAGPPAVLRILENLESVGPGLVRLNLSQIRH
jgi:phosphoglycolate phosphatase-like HAD superfamily hydrolase